ncbi:MAG: PG0541 family transporter-associated protein [bacterium]
MKLVCIVFNSVLMPNVREHLEKCEIDKYTQWSGVTGAGETGAHLGTHVWPGTNTVLFTIVAEDEKKQALQECVKSIRDKHPGEGIKAFVLNVEEMA